MKRMYLDDYPIENRIEQTKDKTFVCVYKSDKKDKLIHWEDFTSYKEAVECFEELKKEYLSKDEFYKIVVVKMTDERIGLPKDGKPLDLWNAPYDCFLKTDFDEEKKMYYRYTLAEFCLCEKNQDKEWHSDFYKFYKSLQKKEV